MTIETSNGVEFTVTDSTEARLSHLPVEVLIEATEPEARISHLPVEVLIEPIEPEARVSHVVVEVLYATGGVNIERIPAEAMSTGEPHHGGYVLRAQPFGDVDVTVARRMLNPFRAKDMGAGATLRIVFRVLANPGTEVTMTARTTAGATLVDEGVRQVEVGPDGWVEEAIDLDMDGAVNATGGEVVVESDDPTKVYLDHLKSIVLHPPPPD
jgi:hypothetical protein